MVQPARFALGMDCDHPPQRSRRQLLLSPLLHGPSCARTARRSRLRSAFPKGLGVCQWFHFEDHRLESSVAWLRKLGVRHLRTGVSWADWFRPDAEAWFDRQMSALDEFEVTMTLCFTPEHLGWSGTTPARRKIRRISLTLLAWAVERYAPAISAGLPEAKVSNLMEAR